MTIRDLVEALEAPERETAVSSVRQPRALRRAMHAAVELGWAATGNEGVNRAVRADLDAFAQRAALEAHYEAHPGLRPSLAQVASALATLDHSELTARPELIERAACEVVEFRADADADDVLLWAMSLRAHAALPDADSGRLDSAADARGAALPS